MRNIKDCLDIGCNHVELAGYGRESTHKGYLTWLLNTTHWPDARNFLYELIQQADGNLADEWLNNFPIDFWCEYERRVGNGKVDLIVTSDQDDLNSQLPIELKTDRVVTPAQLENMHVADLRLGLVFLLGSSAVRDDNATADQAGAFKIIPLDQILSTLEYFESSLPSPGKDWLNALRHEKLRLNIGFQLTDEQRECYWKYGYRSDKHHYFALLKSLRDEENLKGDWYLEDGGHNTAMYLNKEFTRTDFVAETYVYWEFNDNNLCLKIKMPDRDEHREEMRNWIINTQTEIDELWGRYSCTEVNQVRGIVKKRRYPPRRDSKATWVRIMGWICELDTSRNVAARVISVIKHFNRELKFN